MRLILTLTLAFCVCCEGTIGDAGGPSGPGGPGSFNPEDVRFEVRVWRLTPHHFASEIERLFGPGAPDVDLPASTGENGLTNIAANGRINDGNAQTFATAARSIAVWVREGGAERARCDTFGNAACVDQVLDWLPEAAFRREVSNDEKQELRTLFDENAAEYDFDFAYQGMIQAILLHPSFLYRTELGNDRDDETTELTGEEIATLLAFAITDRGPDPMLLHRADRLDDPDVRESEARRLMSQSAPMWQRFFWEWLHMATLYSQGAEVGMSDDLVAQVREEYETFVGNIIVEEGGTFRDLFTSTHTWARPELAGHYGADHSGSGLERVELDPMQRGGLLTQAAWLVSHGKRGRANVVRRGMGLFKDAMCHEIEPPEDLDIEAEQAALAGPESSVAEIVQIRGNHSVCGGCHRVADPVGLIFESYASDGSWQTEYADDGRPVETSITLPIQGSFDFAPELSRALADDLEFQHCFVQRLAHFMVGYDLGNPGAVSWTHDAHESFVEANTSFEELVVAMVRHPAFVERRK